MEERGHKGKVPGAYKSCYVAQYTPTQYLLNAFIMAKSKHDLSIQNCLSPGTKDHGLKTYELVIGKGDT